LQQLPGFSSSTMVGARCLRTAPQVDRPSVVQCSSVASAAPGHAPLLLQRRPAASTAFDGCINQ